MNISTIAKLASVGIALLLLTLLTLLFAPSASAAIVNLSATIDGTQEVPMSGSSATGSATITFDDVTNELNWDITWTPLQGSTVGLHFHGPAAPGVNTGVEVNIGDISGLTSPSIGSATITADQASDLLANLWYINIHSEQFSGGEIRGQVNVIPVPATVWLFGSALLGLVGLAKRKTS